MAINPLIRIKGYIDIDAAVNPPPVRRSLAKAEADKNAVTISEPMTLATDFLLGTLCEVCAVLLLRHNVPLRQASIRLWALALIAVAMGSFAGGTYHGFQHALSVPVAAVLWKATTISMGVASFLLLAAAFSAAFSGQDRRWLIAAAFLKLAIYVAWMLGHDEFRFVIYDYGSTLAILLLLIAAERTHGVRGHRAYIVSGILVSIGAAGVQQSGIQLHRHFNHNDLMHVVQMGGMWLLYKGGARLRDRVPCAAAAHGTGVAGRSDVRQP